MSKGKLLLTILVLVGLALGTGLGQLMFTSSQSIAAGNADQALLSGRAVDMVRTANNIIGRELFMGLLKMLVVPLIVAAVIVGITSIGDFSKLGGIAAKTFIYYFATMLLAVGLGLVLVTLIQPGEGTFTPEQLDQQLGDYSKQLEAEPADETRPGTWWEAVLSIIVRMVPSNPVQAAATGNMLQLIVFSLLLGIALTMIGDTAKPFIGFFQGLHEAMLRLTVWVIWLAPIGVLCLVANSVSDIGAMVFLEKIGKYMGTVAGGLALHGLVTLPLLLLILTRTNPFRFLGQMRNALLLAFSTASSSATLPVTIESAEEFGGVSKRAAGFVLPIGSQINMDGTALYEAVAVVFLAQVFGVELGPTQLLLVAFTATLAAVGAAGIPEAGLITMLIVVKAVNDSVQGVTIPPEAVVLILGVDRFLDMTRTMINVWGDAVGSKIISHYDRDPAADPGQT